MTQLPQKIGPFTLVRDLGSDGVVESFGAILDEPAGKQVVVHRVLAGLMRDPPLAAAIEARGRDLVGLRHPSLVPLIEVRDVEGDRFLVEEAVDAPTLDDLLAWCRAHDTYVPPPIFLHLATQMCNALEALHGRPGATTGADNLLHLALGPHAVRVAPDGRVLLGGFGLVRSPTSLPQAAGKGQPRMAYLAPEQTHLDQKLTPATDLFALAAVLFELATLQPLFSADTPLQTIHKIRGGEISAPLTAVKERLPGLDKVLYRALSPSARHRYQRAFVLREDLRGLMSAYSFANIDEDTQAFLGKAFAERPKGPGAPPPPLAGDEEPSERTDTGVDDTAALIRRAQGDPSTLVPDDDPLWADFDDDPPVTDEEPKDEAPASNPDTTWLRADKPLKDEPKEPSKGDAPPAEEQKAASLAESVPPPPPRENDPEPELDDEEPQEPARSQTGLLIGLGAVAVLLLGVGVAGVGGLFLYQTLRSGDPPPATAAVVPDDRDQGEPAGATDDDVGADDDDDDDTTLAQVDDPDGADDADAPSEPAPSPPEPAPSPSEPSPPTPSPEPEPEPASAATGDGERDAPTAPEPPEPIQRPSDEVAPALSRLADEDEDEDAVAMASPEPESEDTEPAPSLDGPDADVAVDLDEPVALPPAGADDMDAYSDRAHRGALADSERASLEAVESDQPEFTRARILLYQDARAREDVTARRVHLSKLMSVPQNQYDPVLLVEQAELDILDGRFEQALERANLAERHWARIPSDLIFSRQAMIYEIQAAAHQGVFYVSEGDDLGALDDAIRAWERYLRHVRVHERPDLYHRAEDQLARLNDMRRRLE